MPNSNNSVLEYYCTNDMHRRRKVLRSLRCGLLKAASLVVGNRLGAQAKCERVDMELPFAHNTRNASMHASEEDPVLRVPR